MMHMSKVTILCFTCMDKLL